MSLSLYRAQRLARRLIADGIPEPEAIGAAAYLHHVPVAPLQRFVELALAGISDAWRELASGGEEHVHG